MQSQLHGISEVALHRLEHGGRLWKTKAGESPGRHLAWSVRSSCRRLRLVVALACGARLPAAGGCWEIGIAEVEQAVAVRAQGQAPVAQHARQDAGQRAPVLPLPLLQQSSAHLLTVQDCSL